MKTIKERAQKLYKSVNTIIISTVDSSGYPITKAVMPGKIRDSINDIYVCTNTSSNFAQMVKGGAKASAYFYSRKLIWKGCLLVGDINIVEDMDIKAKFWQKKFKKAYPEESYTDPDFCVLKFTPKSGRFYSWFTPEDFEI